jgi:hypothetical protein
MITGSHVVTAAECSTAIRAFQISCRRAVAATPNHITVLWKRAILLAEAKMRDTWLEAGNIMDWVPDPQPTA